jgi:hypothetical protein
VDLSEREIQRESIGRNERKKKHTEAKDVLNI